MQRAIFNAIGWAAMLNAALCLAQVVSTQPDNSVVRVATLSVMPAPASAVVTPGRLPLGPGFRISLEQFTDARLERAVDRALRRLESRTAITLAHTRTRNSEATLVIYADGPGMRVQGLEENEGYLLVTQAQQASLRAHSVVGILRGLETFLQLLQADRDGFYFPLVRIEDLPRWRTNLLSVPEMLSSLAQK